jgi:molybdopterin-guanine dinucleotide biosynthesis protein A
MGRDKALIEIDGEPMFVRAARSLAQVADPVVLARGDRPLPGTDWTQIADERAGAGPLGGLVAALRWSPHELLIAVAVDMPYASPAVFQRCVEIWGGQDAVVPITEDGMQPLHALYARSALGPFGACLRADRLSLREALDELNVLTVEVDVTDRFALNVNTPHDLGLFDLGEG